MTILMSQIQPEEYICGCGYHCTVGHDLEALVMSVWKYIVQGAAADYTYSDISKVIM